MKFRLFAAAATIALAASATAGDGGCAGDVDGDGSTGIGDIIAVISTFGGCPEEPDPCPADLDGDGLVDFNDLIAVIMDYGCGAEGCEVNEDCDDADDCTLDICINGTCLNIPLPGCE